MAKTTKSPSANNRRSPSIPKSTKSDVKISKKSNLKNGVSLKSIKNVVAVKKGISKLTTGKEKYIKKATDCVKKVILDKKKNKDKDAVIKKTKISDGNSAKKTSSQEPKKTELLVSPSKVVTRRDSRENPFLMKAGVAVVVEQNQPKKEHVPKFKTENIKKDVPKIQKKVSFDPKLEDKPKKKKDSKDQEKAKKPVSKGRVASLNAKCKVKMMYETEGPICDKKVLKVSKEDKSGKKKSPKKLQVKKKPAKRKNNDVDEANIIQSRSTKRVASLNASAILAATLLPEPPLPKPVAQSKISKRSSTPSVNDEMRVIEEITSKVEVSSTSTTTTTSKQQIVVQHNRSSNLVKKSPKGNKKAEMQIAIPESSKSSSQRSPKVTGVTTTKLEVTKVQINRSSAGKEKTDHQMQTILGKDFVSKYHIETTNSSQSYCVRVQNSSLETHQPIGDQAVRNNPPNMMSVPPAAHMNSSHMSTSAISFPTFPSSHIHQPRTHVRPMIQVGSIQGNPVPFSNSLSILNIPQFAVSGPPAHQQPGTQFRAGPFGVQPGLDLSHGNYTAASPGYALLGSSPLYQPAGPLIQPDSSCLIHKPIPFHPSHHSGPIAFPQSGHSQNISHTQSLSSVPGGIFTTSNLNPGTQVGLFPPRFQQVQSQTIPCPPIFVSNLAQNAFGYLPQIRAGIPIVHGNSDNFSGRNLPWFPEIPSATVSASNFQKEPKISYQASSQYPRSPHVATVRPQVSKKQKDLSRSSKKSPTSTVSKDGRQSTPRAEIVPPPKKEPQAPLLQKVPANLKNKRRFVHGWTWFGKRFFRRVFVQGEAGAVKEKPCYMGIKHVEGEVIKVGDSVLLRSGPRKTDLPFVARITALWESTEGEMMMSLLWFYRPEHTELGRTSRQMPQELFASKHRDANSVACVDDKCFVLTFSEFCRFKRFQRMAKFMVCKSLSDGIVPRRTETNVRRRPRPPLRTSADMIFCCRKVYDFRQKRTLKNPA